MHNEQQVKLAEATRIRLNLPGLNLAQSSSSKDSASASNKQAGGKAAGVSVFAAAG